MILDILDELETKNGKVFHKYSTRVVKEHGKLTDFGNFYITHLVSSRDEAFSRVSLFYSEYEKTPDNMRFYLKVQNIIMRYIELIIEYDTIEQMLHRLQEICELDITTYQYVAVVTIDGEDISKRAQFPKEYRDYLESLEQDNIEQS